MYTIDASVHISALNPNEADSAASRAFLIRVRQRQIPLYSPTLLAVEIAAALARILGDAERAVALAQALRSLPNQTLVPLDGTLADQAACLAASVSVRGADAVYGAVAQRYGTQLITLDRQQLERLSPLVSTARPADLLAET
jgi:predicted nucleic acid-binding protein